MKNDNKLKGCGVGTCSPITAPLESQRACGKSGRHFYLTWAGGDEFATFKWTRPRPSDDLEMAHLPCQVTKFLARYCMPHMPNGKVPCFTSFVDAKGDRYRAHPCYDGKLWNDYAMVEWEGFDFPFPAFIHTFVDLLELPTGSTINIAANGQGEIEAAGLYALVHSFDPVDEDDIALPNTLVGHYTPHFFSNDTRPTLFLVHVKAIRSPTLGVADVPFGSTRLPRRERHHLFLIRRKDAWPRAWDSMINSCRSPNDTDDTVFETEYEKLVTMPDGTKVSTVKTADDFADMVAAEVAAKERKDAEKKKKTKKTSAVETDETVFDETPVAMETPVADRTAVPRRSLENLKRKRNTPGKRSRR